MSSSKVSPTECLDNATVTLSFTRTSLQECLKLDWLDVGDESGSEFMCGVLSWPMIWRCIQKLASSYFLHQLWRHYVALNMRNYTVTANYKHPNHPIMLTFAVVAWINKYIYIERHQKTHLPNVDERKQISPLLFVWEVIFQCALKQDQWKRIFTVLSQISLFMYGVDHTFWYNSHSHIHHSHL